MNTSLTSDSDMKQRIRRALELRFRDELAATARLEKMGGHASLRIYWRVHLPEEGERTDIYDRRGESSVIAMVLPTGDEAFQSAEGPSNEAAPPDELPFVEVQRYLKSTGLPVPEIDFVDLDIGVLLLEDLGDTSFEDVYLRRVEAADASSTRSETTELYREALDLLVDVQRTLLDAEEELGDEVCDACICWERGLERDELRWELEHYIEWGVEARHGEDDYDAERVEAHREELDAQFDRLVDELLELPTTVSLRDYQSRNLMYKPGFHPDHDFVLIDFQDALVGPFVYDLVALLRDSYIELPPDVVASLVDDYIARGQIAGLPWCDTPADVHRAFYLQTIQRKLKDAGRFIFIDRQKNNPDFLEYYEPSIGYVEDALERLDGWETLRDLLAEIEPHFTI